MVCLIKSVLTESVVTGGEKQNRFLASHAAQLVKRLDNGVEHTRLVKSRNEQTRDRLAYFRLVLREVHRYFGLYIESLKRDPILGSQILQKAPRPSLAFIAEEPIITSAEFHQDHNGDRSFARSKIRNLLRLTFIEDSEVFLLQPRDDIAFVVCDDRVDVHHVRFHRDRHLRRGRLSFWTVLLAGWLFRRLWLLGGSGLRRTLLLLGVSRPCTWRHTQNYKQSHH